MPNTLITIKFIQYYYLVIERLLNKLMPFPSDLLNYADLLRLK